MIKRRRYIAAGLLVLAVILGHQLRYVCTLGFYNFTPSAPKGFYLKAGKSGPLERGEYVTLAVPDKAQELVYGRGWMSPGTPLIKTVGALPGDMVMIKAEGLYVNGQYRGPVFTEDSEGLPLPQIRGSFVIREGEFLPLSAYERSFDGRYFGPVPLTAISYRVEPFLTY